MDEDNILYGSRPRPSYIVLDRVKALRERGTAAHLFSAHVYCGHGRPSQVLLSSCFSFSFFSFTSVCYLVGEMQLMNTRLMAHGNSDTAGKPAGNGISGLPGLCNI